MAIRIPMNNVRKMGRNARGVKAIKLKKDDKVVSLSMFTEENEDLSILTITKRGFGKRTDVNEYRQQTRGGVGLKNMAWAASMGEVVTVQVVNDSDEVIGVSRKGYTIRFAASDIRKMGRSTRGVKTIDLSEDDELSSVERIIHEEELD